MTDFFEVVRAQRACRAFSDASVADETVARVLEAATYAPSAENTQPWVFVVVRDADARARIGELTRRAWESRGRDVSRGRLAPSLFADVDRGATVTVAAAPVLVLVGADTERCFPTAAPASIFPAVQNLLLAAGALGLGSALTTITTAYAHELREIVGFPGSIVPLAVVPLGFPARPLSPPRRASLTEKAHRERYGSRW